MARAYVNLINTFIVDDDDDTTTTVEMEISFYSACLPSPSLPSLYI